MGVSSWSRKLAAQGAFFWREKEGMLGDFSGAENRACWVFLLQ